VPSSNQVVTKVSTVLDVAVAVVLMYSGWYWFGHKLPSTRNPRGSGTKGSQPCPKR